MKDQIIILQGEQPASAAEWTTASISYLPFEVPEGVCAIQVHRDVEPREKHVVAMMLYDARGIVHGFRGYQGQVNIATDFTITADPGTTTSWYIPGPLIPGTWHIGHWFVRAITETLHYRYTITLSFGPTRAASLEWPAYNPGVVNPERGWYVGALHNHTLYSYDAQIGGTPYSPSGLMRKYADAGFDFLAITDHNQPRSHMDAPAAALENPDTLLILGNEITTLHGHSNTLFVPPGTTFDFRIDPGDGRLPDIADQIHAVGALMVVNHPFQRHADCTWRFPEHEWDKADAIEVWNRPWMDTNREAVDMWDGLLKQGRRITAIGGADYHRGDAPIVPATWVHVRELSLDGVREGLLKGRVFLSESPEGPVIYLNTADGRAMAGDSVDSAPDAPVGIIVRVERAAGCTLRLISRFAEHSERVTSDDHLVEHAIVPNLHGDYFRVEVLRPNGDVAALTNPIYFNI
ncbi:MAG TPA: CehA/McbA family metallohydrolase [Armatimonadota bacterium]|jgi:hypothetical protein